MNWFDLLTNGYTKTIKAIIAYAAVWFIFAILLSVVLDLIPGRAAASMIGAGVIVILMAVFNVLLAIQDSGGFDQ